MIAKYTKQTNTFVGISILGTIIAFLIFGSNEIPLVITLALTISFMYGVFSYAKAKGYSGWLGVLLGFLNLLGLIILVLLPDKAKTAS